MFHLAGVLVLGLVQEGGACCISEVAWHVML